MEEDSLAVMGLKVFGSPNIAMTRRPPGWPGSISYLIGGSGSGLAASDFPESLRPQPTMKRRTRTEL